MLNSTPAIDSSRRQLLKGIAAFSASVVLAGCNKSQMISSSPVSVSAAAGSQPTPSGPTTQALLSVHANGTGTIGQGFAGLFVATLPIVVIYLFTKKYYVEGLTLGSLK